MGIGKVLPSLCGEYAQVRLAILKVAIPLYLFILEFDFITATALDCQIRISDSDSSEHKRSVNYGEQE